MAHLRNANQFIEEQLDARLSALENASSADVVAFCGGILGGVDDVFRSVVENQKDRNSGRKKISVLMTTGGGYIEVVSRIVDTLRYHYAEVDFIVPNYAYSAGTVLAMSGNAIHMDYYSRLGPIDPQVENSDGKWVPALGYLTQYERLVKKAQAGTLTAAEAELMISGFDQAELYQYEQARELSITLLKQWLVNYKFKNWTKTATRGIPVTPSMRTNRAKQIATELNKTEKWHTHGRGISMDVLNNDLNLLIDDFGKNAALRDAIKEYYHLLDDYKTKRGDKGVLHAMSMYVPFM
jgi:hypothetical protein